MEKKEYIIIYGPTGVGKTDTILALGKQKFSIEIINCDVGQFYAPVGIGTAKPDWKNESIPHHLFDILDEPKNLTVVEYRTLVLDKMSEVHAAGNVPVLVGGSGFYYRSLFYPPVLSEEISSEVVGSWEDLYEIDPVRAAQIEKNDTYRVNRALSLAQVAKPSQCIPAFNPPEGRCLLLFLKRDRDELYQRINNRVQEMIQEGWLDEVQSILGTKWEQFLLTKKLIGYPELINYLHHQNEQSLDLVVQMIQKKTRNYAKRQFTFWRMLKKMLESEQLYSPSQLKEIDAKTALKDGSLQDTIETFLQK